MALLVTLAFSAVARAQSGGLPWDSQKTATDKPQALENVGIDEKLGANLDKSIEFTDENGKTVRLSDYFDGNRPVMLSPVYFSCPSLCNLHLNGLVESLKRIDWTIGKEFVAIAVSIDSEETPALASAKKANYVKSYGRPEASGGWHFLTGSKANVERLTQQVGFKFKWDPETKQWSHAAAAILISPDGTISRYLHGISFTNQNVRMGLMEASNGEIGKFVDKMVMYCFKYDPTRKGYAFYAYNLMKVGGAITVLILGYILIGFWLRQRREAIQS